MKSSGAPSLPDGKLGNGRLSPLLRQRAVTLGVLLATATVPGAALAAPSSGGTRSFHVDSLLGDDNATGRAAKPGGGDGPWRTLARAAAAELRPGDELVLACGSTWNETLKVRASGTPSRPIVVRAAQLDCGANAPAIDGSLALAPSDWAPEGSAVYRARLPTRPLQLRVGGQVWPAAHHPNRGQASDWPDSVYVRMPEPGGTAMVDGRLRGTSVVLPQAALPAAGPPALVGATIHVRTNAWALEERKVAGVEGNRLLLDVPTVYPATAGWGAYLSGQAWMLDSPLEWHYDETTKTLRAWWPDQQRPDASARVTLLEVGVDLVDRAHVQVRGIAVRHVGTGLLIEGSRGIALRQMKVTDVADIGVAAAGSRDLLVQDSTFLRMGTDAIQGMARDRRSDATGMRVVGNDIGDSGIQPAQATVPALPTRSFAAVYGGPGATIENNHIRRSGYIGIRFMRDSRVAGNLVEDSCLVLNDCAGIYTWGKEPNNSRVARNVVQRAVGNVDGSPRNMASAGQGIYLDLGTTGAVVENNTVTGVDHGIQVHIARGNTIRGNWLVGNRRSQIWLQATTQEWHPDGDVADIEVTGNLLATTLPASVAVLLHTRGASTAHFGRFESNRYLDSHHRTLVRERTSRGVRDFAFTEWQAADGVGSTQARDAKGFSTRQQPFALGMVAGPSLLAQGVADSRNGAWRSYAAGRNPAVNAEPCPAGRCLRIAADDKPAILISPPFALSSGMAYGLSVDLQVDAPPQAVQLVVRRNGGGPRPYAPLADRDLSFVAGAGWTRHRLTFQATEAATPDARLPGGGGARVDLEGLVSGRALSLARIELAPLRPPPGLAAPPLLVNPGKEALTLACPLAPADSAACSTLHSLATGRPVQWPLVLPPGTAEVLWVADPRFRDADRDGIPDFQDACPGTPANAGVDNKGCAVGQ